MPIEKQTIREQRPEEPVANQLEYKVTIESLQYAATISQPDISFATGLFARYTKNQSLIYLEGMKQILPFLRGTMMIRLYLYIGSGTSKPSLVSYGNADYSRDNKDSQSTSEILIKYSDFRLNWR